MQKKLLVVPLPLLPGSVYPSKVKCGKPNCQCMINPDKRHVTYQWSGMIDGKNTSRSLTKEAYEECKKRITNYKNFQSRIKKIIDDSIKKAPWLSST